MLFYFPYFFNFWRQSWIDLIQLFKSNWELIQLILKLRVIEMLLILLTIKAEFQFLLMPVIAIDFGIKKR